MKSLLSLLGPLLLTPVGSAQTSTVIPRGLAAREGNSASWVPTKYNYSRVQYLYAAAAMPAQGVTIKSIRLRRDADSPLAFLGYSQEVEVFMSNLEAGPVAGYSRIWEDNRGKDHACVVQKTSIIYPSLAPVATGPASFAKGLTFILDKPFAYQKGKAFLIEFVTHAKQAFVAEWLADAEVDTGWTGYPTGASRTYSGRGCPASFRNFGDMPYIGYRWHHYGYCQTTAPGISAIDLIGIRKDKLGGVSLPLDLGPFGAAGCHLYLVPLLYQPGFIHFSSHTGLIDFDLGLIPNQISLVGARYYEQQLVLDSSHNDLGVRLSPLASCTIGGGFTGSPPGFQLVAYGPGFRLDQKYADWYGAKSLVVELVY